MKALGYYVWIGATLLWRGLVYVCTLGRISAILLLCGVSVAQQPGRYTLTETDGALTFTPYVEPTPEPPAPSVVDSPTGYEPRLLWSPRAQATYKRMVEEGQRDWLELKAQADRSVKGTPDYGDYGQPATIVYQATGDPRYASAGYKLVMTWLNKEPDTNTLAGYAWEFAVCVEWLRPSLSADEITAAETQLRRWADIMLGIGEKPYGRGGLGTISDDDRDLGYVLGLQAIGKVVGEDYLSRTTDPAVGAPVPVINARAAISTLYAPLASGGVYPSSTMYDHMTERVLVPGIRAVGGYDEWRSLWPQIARGQVAEITADLEENMRWGDNEERNLVNRRINYRLDVLRLLSAELGEAAEGRWCRWMAEALRAKHSEPFVKPTHRAFWMPEGFYGEREEPPATLSVDSAVGVYLRKYADRSLIATFHPLTGIQHQYERWGDFSLYLGGEHVIDRPLGYAGGYDSQVWGNNLLLCGLGAMQYRASGRSWDYVWGETSGPYFAPHPAYYNPPPSFVRRCRREIALNGSWVRDVVDMDDPRKLPNYDRYGTALRTRMDAADLLAIGFNSPAEPMIGDHAMSWRTPKGHGVKLFWTDDREIKYQQVLNGGEWGNTATWRIRLVPRGYAGGPIELVTKVEISR